MRPYGESKKRIHKIHPANECKICEEKKPPSKKRARRNSDVTCIQIGNDEYIDLRHVRWHADEYQY